MEAITHCLKLQSKLAKAFWNSLEFLLLKTFPFHRNLIQDESQVTQAWGLIVLLFSRTAGHACEFPEEEFVDKNSGILSKQKALAEICEIIRLSQLVHQGMINLQHLKNAGNDLSSDSEMIVGNKIALLGGDYLLGNACIQLGELRYKNYFMKMPLNCIF